MNHSHAQREFPELQPFASSASLQQQPWERPDFDITALVQSVDLRLLFHAKHLALVGRTARLVRLLQRSAPHARCCAVVSAQVAAPLLPTDHPGSVFARRPRKTCCVCASALQTRAARSTRHDCDGVGERLKS